jgi:hypothetical protein
VTLDLLPDLAIIAGLVHVEAEVRKCTWDYWVFKCPLCQQGIKLEHMQFMGVQKFRCACGFEGTFGFNQVVKRWTGPPPKVTDELL